MRPVRRVGRLSEIVTALADRLIRRRASAEELGVGDRVVTRLGPPRSAADVPLVVGLHGFGSSETQLGSLVPLPTAAPNVEYLGLRGEWSVVGGGYAWFPVGGHDEASSRADLDELDAAVDGLADTLRSLRGSGDRSVWLIGYSQGAPMALHTLERHPDLLAGVAVGAGGFVRGAHEPGAALTRRHAFIAASTADRFVPAADHDATVERLRTQGAEVRVVCEAVPHVISDTQAEAIDTWLLGLLGRAGRTVGT